MTKLVTPPNHNALTLNTTIPAKVESQVDYLVLDGSGSMKSKWWDMIDAMDAYLKILRRDAVNSHVVATVFSDGDYMDIMQRNGQLNDIPLLGEDPPLGSVFSGTALYDAINIGTRNLAKMDPERAHFFLGTDGEEIDSRFTDLTQAKALVNWMKSKGWQVTIIGCDWDSQKLADELGVEPSQAIGVSKANLSGAAEALADKRVKYARTGAPMHWSEDEQRQFGGYLAAPK